MIVLTSLLGWFTYGFIALIIWFAIAFWPARVAGRKGHSFLGFFLLSLLFFPLSLILAYVVQDRHAPTVHT
jgi:energy-coupling factor transporter transmembrane protein EcfT